MPQPRGCRGSSKVRSVNSISRICRFPSPIKTHFFVFGCAESEKNFTSVGIFHRSGKGRGKFRERYAADSPAERFFPLRRRDSNGKHCFFSACPHDGVFRRLISGNTEKTKRALCALCTQRPFLLSLISAQKGFMPLPLRKLDAVRRKALCHRGIDIHRAVRKSLIIAP